MSNVIKNGYFIVSDRNIKVIEDNSENFKENDIFANFESKETTPSDENQEESIRDASKILKEREEALRLEEERLSDKADEVIRNASETAETILSSARKQADSIRQVAESEGREIGYNEGMEKGEVQIQQMRQELEEELARKQSEFDKKAESFEADFVDLASSIIEQITGIIVEDKQEVISHIINRTLSEIEKSENYLIRVSREDYEYVCSKKMYFQDCLKDGASLEIVESEKMDKNKCLIETDNSVIDCSLDAQLNNLITDLKILSRV